MSSPEVSSAPESKTQTAASVYEQCGPITIVMDHTVPNLGDNEVLVKVLYTGVCQSVQYARAAGAHVIALDAGPQKKDFVMSMGAEAYIDVTSTKDPVAEVQKIVGGPGAHSVIVAAGSPKAYEYSAELRRPGGTTSCCGIAPDIATIHTPAAAITIKNLKIVGNLIGNSKEALEAVEFVRRGVVKPKVQVRAFNELPQIYEQLEKGEIEGRVVIKVATDE